MRADRLDTSSCSWIATSINNVPKYGGGITHSEGRGNQKKIKRESCKHRAGGGGSRKAT